MPNLSDIPDIEFTAGITADTLLASKVTEYEDAYYQQTGTRKTLAQGDPIRVFLYAQALREFQLYQLLEIAARQNLLKYASGAYLDNLAARNGIVRLPAQKAVTTLLFTLSAAQGTPVAIPQGTRVTAGDDMFFETTAYAEIATGQTTTTVAAQCQTAGVSGNGYVLGQLSILVDPIAFMQSVSNTTVSQGGSNIEDDESLRERVFLAPESFSAAGPAGAYEYHIKAYSQSIIDVYIDSPDPGDVDIRFLLTDGEIPGASLISEVDAYISGSDIRPLTDDVTVSAPGTVSYDIDVTYYIYSGDADKVSDVQAAVTSAVDEYVIWQRSKIGRDINPSELIKRIVAAGALYCTITAPTQTAVANTSIAVIGTKTVTYGGLS